MRILILSQYYKPEPIPKPSELAHALRQQGDKVTVITGFPNYPSGHLYEGYRLGLLHREEVDGVQILRTFEYPYHGRHAIGRFVNYFTFMLSAPVGSLFAPKFDVIYVWHPPLTIGVSAWLIARLRRVPFVYDVQDIWPEAAVLSGILKPGFVVRLLSALERFIYRRADHLLVVTEGARSNLISKGVPPEKITVMPHWFDSTIFSQLDGSARDRLRSLHGWNRQIVILFAGNIGLVQGLETVVHAAELLRDERSIRFVFIGDGADKSRLQDLVQSHSLAEKVQFIERQPMDRMPEYMAAADGLLVHLKRSELSNYVIPTKTLAYLASGKAIIMAMHGAAAKLVEDAGAGYIVPPEEPEALADIIRSFAALSMKERDAMGSRGKNYLAQNLSKDIIIPRYRKLLEHLVAKAKQRNDI
jgi:glycosyltransferase involved in cell wall biosynthesis